jgi:hypothetical protein
MQTQKSVRKRAAIGPGVHHETIIDRRQVPEIPERATVRFIEKGADFLGKATHPT